MRLRVPLQTLADLAADPQHQYGRVRPLPKPDGGAPRPIEPPRRRLKAVQRRIHVELLAPLWLPEPLHAYRGGRSIRTAALPHQGAPFLWVADIRRFFPSISNYAVYRMFWELGCTPDVARLLTRLTSHRGRLPQGAPTSPTLANLFLRLSGVVHRLAGVCDKHDLGLTFFGDDILISGSRPFQGLTAHFAAIITSAGLRLHPVKTGPVRGPRDGHRVLGINLNSDGGEINVLRRYRRRVKTLLHIYARRGPEGLIAAGVRTRDPKAYLRGCIAFAVWVNPRNRDLRERFDQIVGS
jgi:hypothetical protein